MKQNRVALSKPIPVKLDPDLLRRIEAISVELGEPKSTVMRFAMRIGIRALEGITDSEQLRDILKPETGVNYTKLGGTPEEEMRVEEKPKKKAGSSK